MRDERFAPPAGFDAVAQVERAIASMPGALPVEVLLETTLEEARRLIPPAAATLEETPCGILVRGQAQDRQGLAWMAHVLAGLRCPLIILRPPELRDELRALALHTAWLAERTEP